MDSTVLAEIQPTQDTPVAPITAPVSKHSAALVSAAETRRRCAAVIIAINSGIDRIADIHAWSQIPDPATRRPWNVTPRTIKKYRSRAYEQLERDAEETRERSRAGQLGIRRHLYAMAVSQANVPAALAVAKDHSELLGLYPEKGTLAPPANINVVAASIQQAIADPRYIEWLELQAAAGKLLDQPDEDRRNSAPLDSGVTSNPDSTEHPCSVEDDLPSCDEQDEAAVDRDSMD